MKTICVYITLLTLIYAYGCGQDDAPTEKTADLPPAASGEATILQSWHGDYPVARLQRLPDGQREAAVGFINDAETLKPVWEAFEPDEAVPDVDFNTSLVLFARNTQFYNRIRIGKVTVTNGVAEILAAETMSAMPIEDKVAMSMAVVAREGITAIRSGDTTIQIKE